MIVNIPYHFKKYLQNSEAGHNLVSFDMFVHVNAVLYVFYTHCWQVDKTEIWVLKIRVFVKRRKQKLSIYSWKKCFKSLYYVTILFSECITDKCHISYMYFIFLNTNKYVFKIKLWQLFLKDLIRYLSLNYISFNIYQFSH